MADVNNDSSLDDAKTEIENGVSDYFSTWFGSCVTKNIGEWDDDHKWNNINIKGKRADKEWENI